MDTESLRDQNESEMDGEAVVSDTSRMSVYRVWGIERCQAERGEGALGDKNSTVQYHRAGRSEAREKFRTYSRSLGCPVRGAFTAPTTIPTSSTSSSPRSRGPRVPIPIAMSATRHAIRELAPSGVVISLRGRGRGVRVWVRDSISKRSGRTDGRVRGGGGTSARHLTRRGRVGGESAGEEAELRLLLLVRVHSLSIRRSRA